MRATRGEVERVFSKMNYKIINLEEEEAAIKYERLNKKINLDELEDRASDELLEPLRKDKEYFEMMIDTSVSKEAVNKLFTQLKKRGKLSREHSLRRKETRQRLRISFIDKTRSIPGMNSVMKNCKGVQ